jgi:hypothetical protein
MDKELARRYVERWKAVREIEIAEKRQLPVEQRLRQFFRLCDATRHFPEHPAVRAIREREIEEVRARWTKLKEGY